MTTAYIVTQGEYSSYRIVAVFTDKATAKTYAASLSDGHYGTEADVEEWTTDVPEIVAAAVRNLWPWTVSQRIATGVLYVSREREDNAPEVAMHIEHEYDPYWTATIHARDKEQALKVFTERLMQHKVSAQMLTPV